MLFLVKGDAISVILINLLQLFIYTTLLNYDRAYDRAVALNRLEKSGVVMTTSESAIFDLIKSADHPNFKAISGMIKEHNKLTNEFAKDQSI